MVRYTDMDIVQGVLIDFDLASLGQPIGESHHGRRTGTRRFMSRELLVKETPLHLERFDWESFFYVLCWIGTHYSEGTEIQTNALHPWDTDNDDTLIVCKSAALGGSNFPALLSLFTAFYSPMYGSWIAPMQQMFIAADGARTKLVEAQRANLNPGDSGLSLDEGTVGGCITWERLWGIIKN